MNHSYNTISLEEAGSLSVLQLIEMYNDAIETIWYLQERLNELSVENDALWDDYEELSNVSVKLKVLYSKTQLPGTISPNL
jgi:FtsZ-binding cell division protein ZapB